MARVYKSTAKIKRIISEKMQTLDDFGICNKYDENMRSKLEQEIAKYPNKDAREVVDRYCRPMIQEKVNSWV